MENVLIITAGEKSGASLTQYLSAANVRGRLVVCLSGAEARRLLASADFDLIVINAPLPDEFGGELSQFAAQQTSAGILLLTKAEIAGAVAEKLEGDGVFVLPKPLNRDLFFQSLHLARAVHSRVSSLTRENRKLQQRIEDIRLVDRAKCILIECCAMTEPEAHSYIEKQAMDHRVNKRDVARQILNSEELP